MSNLYFWAQSLDNESQDWVSKNAEELTDKVERRQVVGDINNVSGLKKEVSSELTIVIEKSKFVIEAVPEEKDSGGRLAPIVIYGEIPRSFHDDNSVNDWIDETCNEINHVVNNKIERNFKNSVKNDIREGLKYVANNKKKEESQKKLLTDCGIVFIATLLEIQLLSALNFQVTLVNISGMILVNVGIVKLVQRFLETKKY